MQLHLWMEEASCRKRRNDFWYPPLDTDVPDNYYAIGREVCHRCPVWDKCLDAGIDEKWGMWGGLTPQERTVIVTTNPKPSAIKQHGSWIRYRQGCRCSDCIEGNNQPTNKINMNVIPKHGEPVQDLEMLRFNLLST
jgi:hypothetical protein